MAKSKTTTPTAYLERWLEDADVRNNLVRAIESIRMAFLAATGRQAGKVTKRTRVQRRVRDAARSLVRAGAAAREAERKRMRAQRRRRIALLMLLAGGGAAAVAAARSKTDQRPNGQGAGGSDFVSRPAAP
jgi:hypothetical protein